MSLTPVPQTDRPSAPFRVLAADPDPDVRALYQQAFAGGEYDFGEASDGRDALVKAFVRVPALVITELRLPLIDGIDLCELLRQDPTTATVPLVIATTETHPTEIRRARQVADVVLVKPTRSEVVLTECARLLAKSQTLRGRVAELCVQTSESLGVSTTILGVSAELRHGRRRTRAVSTHSRYTTTAPPASPPVVICPSCDRLLTYELSYVGGVNEHHPEQWDYFVCSTCGTFQYRQRTRKMRPLRADEEQWMQRLRAVR